MYTTRHPQRRLHMRNSSPKGPRNRSIYDVKATHLQKPQLHRPDAKDEHDTASASPQTKPRKKISKTRLRSLLHQCRRRCTSLLSIYVSVPSSQLQDVLSKNPNHRKISKTGGCRKSKRTRQNLHVFIMCSAQKHSTPSAQSPTR